MNTNPVVIEYEKTLDAIIDSGVDTTLNYIEKYADYYKEIDRSTTGTELRLMHDSTRFASALTKWASRSSTTFTHLELERVCFKKTYFCNVFFSSGYITTTHLVSSCLDVAADGSISGPKSKIYVVLALISINDIERRLLDYALALDAKILLPLIMGWLSERIVFTERGQQNRNHILQMGHLIKDAKINSRYFPTLGQGWMYTSYATIRDKHKFKITLNKLVGDMLRGWNVPEYKVQEKNNIRPKILVVNEVLKSSHAMFRCYKNSIASLKEHFEVMGFAFQNAIDAESKELFDSGYYPDGKKDTILQTIDEIRNLAPDLIYFPSIGMNSSIIMLSNIRLAPLQIVGQGHPATTYSPFIDYCVSFMLEGDAQKLYSEKLIMYEDNSLFSPHQDLTAFPPVVGKIMNYEKEAVKIAVNARGFKISHDFIRACKAIVAKSSKKIEFNFFPGDQGLAYAATKSMIQQYLENFLVHELMPYPSMLRIMAECDVCMAPFPFGNTNGTVDACWLGLPTVALVGGEPSSQTDKFVMKLAGYPEWLSVSNADEYVNLCVSLIEDHEWRRSLRNSLPRGREVALRLFNEDKSILGDIIKKIHDGEINSKRLSLQD